MVDSFFSYKKRRERKAVADFNILIDTMIDRIMDKVFERLSSEKVTFSKKNSHNNSDNRTFREILEEEVSKFDSIEEVQYLGKYLVEYWKKIHLK